MKRKPKYQSFLCAALAFSLLTAGCSAAPDSGSSKNAEDLSSVAEELSKITETADNDASAGKKAVSISEKLNDIFSERDLSGEFSDPNAEIHLGGDSVTAEGTGAEADGCKISITKEGTYIISGTLNDGQIIVNTEGKVQLVLNNADISCSDSSAIYIMNADKVFITMPDGTDNKLSDGSSYKDFSEENNEPDSCIFSTDSLTLNGKGKLSVKGCFNEGITSKDDIVIAGCTLDVESVGSGIKGKDYVASTNAVLNVTAGGDGIKSTNADDENLGFVYIQSGEITVTADEDAIQAETELITDDGTFTLTAGGGAAASTKEHSDIMGFGGMGGKKFGGGMQRPDDDGSRKRPDFNDGDMPTPPDFEGGEMPQFEGGDMPTPPDFDDGEMPQFEGGDMPTPPDFEGGEMPQFEGGDMPTPPDFEGGDMPQFDGGDMPTPPDFEGGEMPQTDDSSADSDTSDEISTKGIKGGSRVCINGGNFTIDSADDALHSNGNIEINGGTLTLSSGDDGIHADDTLTISDGTIDISESYEGIEAADIQISGGTVRVSATDDGLNASDGSSQGGMGQYTDALITISGGFVYVNADGDGLDSNGDMLISGGTVLVDGPTNNGNGALDSNGEITVNGGILVAAGAAGMAETPSDKSEQSFISVRTQQTLAENTLVTVTDSSGTEVLSYMPSKTFSSIVISSPDIKTDETYTVMTGGSSSAESDCGLFTVGGYNNDGTKYSEVTPSV